ncbi:MAG: VCBS repeat-containing protein, partial [Ignavibacteriae bacterium]|nr:VCBS repeat-containing protein [Ignavibacteriota bacterium]
MNATSNPLSIFRSRFYQTRHRVLIHLSVSFVLLCGLSSASAQVAAIGSPASASATNTIASFTAVAGTNRVLIVTASDAASTNITGVTFDGNAMTERAERNDGTAVDAIYTFSLGTSAGPTTGAIVMASTNGVHTGKVVTARVFENVDQATPLTSILSADNTTTPSTSTLTVTSATGDLVFDIFDSFRNSLPGSAHSAGGGQTIMHSVAELPVTGGFAWYSTSTKAGAASVAMSRSTTDHIALIHIAANIKAAVALPLLSINNVTLNELNTGTSTFSFTVSLSAPAGTGGVTFDIGTQDNTATTADNDYIQKTLTSQTIPSGSSTYLFDVTVNGDTNVEPDETFFVNVTNVAGATVSDGQGQGTITNDDVAPFTDIAAALTGVYGSAAWGDYDNDGDLDILLTGVSNSGGNVGSSFVYRNDGSGVFTDINAGLAGVTGSSVAWGDYDNDGDLDILLTGSTNGSNSGAISKVYRNDGGTFTDIAAGLTGVHLGSVAWGDYDNDGDLDILLTGVDAGNTKTSKIYRNDGGTFTDINAALTGVEFSSVAWGDYDNDGDLDIVLAGYDGTYLSKIYRNTAGTFTDINAGLVGVLQGSVAWGDYDNDGDLDILLTGNLSSGRAAKVYRNDNGAYTDINAALTAVSSSAAAWGDYDNDGDLDILLEGYNGSGRTTTVYRNDGGTFTDINAGLALVAGGSVAWGDYDNDGDLDILLSGLDGSSNRISKVYRNNATTPNTVPTAPSGLTATQLSGNRVALAWNTATDAKTSSPNGVTVPVLSYNLRVGTTPGGINTLSPMADVGSIHISSDGLNDGWRRIPKFGPLQTLRDTLTLPPGQYYWGVQAIDAAFAGGPFATEASFNTCPPFTNNRAYVNASAVGANNGTTWADALTSLQSALAVTGTCGVTEIWVAAGTYKPTATSDRTTSFVMINGVAIYGGFPNTGNPTMADRNWTANPTILSGDIGTPNDSTDNSYHVIFNNYTVSTPLTNTAVLDGFTVTGGNANAAAPHCNGGGIYNEYASPTVANCTISNNTVVRSNVTSTESAGGGMYNSNSSPTVSHCTFSQNKALALNTSGHSYGAGMYNSVGSPTITNSTFNSNTTPNDDEDTYGGGMYNSNVTVTVDSCTFTNNQAVFGGGMYNDASSITVTNSTFSGNFILTYPGGVNGGAINIRNSSGTISHCVFLNNSGVGAIGVEVYSGTPALNVSGCTFSGNNYGIANQSATPTVTNCLFTGNAYGGIVNWTGSTNAPTITNCTFSENPGSGLGSISNYGSSAPVLKNCILYGSGNSVFVHGSSVPPAITYSNVKQASGVFAGTGNINQDPLYVNSADPDGADNTWMTSDDGLALQNGSPSINTGDNTGAPSTDIVGNPRPLTVANRADMGAYEATVFHTFIVTNTNDAGAGSLRAAIENANVLANIDAATPDTIVFNIPGGGPHSITPLTPLPAITDPVIVDGYSQPGTSPGVLKIILSGAVPPGSPTGPGAEAVLSAHAKTGVGETDNPPPADGLTISAGNTTVKALVINGFSGNGIVLQTNGGDTLRGNFIGTDVSGTVDLGNGGQGIIVNGTSNNVIGGTTIGDGNLISGNTNFGIYFAGSNGNTVKGNRIGTNINGTSAIPNWVGVVMAGSNNVVGGATAADGNLISGNTGDAIFITQASGANNSVKGNLLGTDVTGTLDLGNGADGIAISGGAANNIIGGATAGERNIISGNNRYGVYFSGTGTTGNKIIGNYIGTDMTGTNFLGNTSDGVLLYPQGGNSVGGTAAGEGNIIAGNGRAGVDVIAGGNNGNPIVGNSIFGNSGLGIDLSATTGISHEADGLTPNDVADADTGANKLQNFPVMTQSQRQNNGDLSVTYSVPSAVANSTYPLHIEFFKAQGGEGKIFLSAQNYAAANAELTISQTFTPTVAVAIGDSIVATATDASGNTSEFSAGALLSSPDPSGITSDDFNTPTLKPFWTFINPGNPSTMSLVGTGTADARLRIQIPDGASHDVWASGNNAPRVMQNCNNIDFEVEVKFDSPLMSQYQLQGVIVEQDAQNFIRFDFVRENAKIRAFVATFAGGAPTVRTDLPIPMGGMVWMRLKREGDAWRQSYSYDGVNFTVTSQFSYPLAVAKIGPFVGNAGFPEGTAPSFDGLIDYFFSLASPIVPEDGTTSGPSITQQPANATVQSGQTATFTVAATGTIPLSYQWQKNSADIVGATNPSYTTPPTTLADNGATFRCIVSNSIGTVTSNAAVLTVTSPAPGSNIVSDDFNSPTLNTSLWTIVNPGTPSTFSMTGTGTADARLSIAVPAGSSHDVWSPANAAPRIMQPAANTDFEVEAKFEQPMTTGYQLEGVIVEQSP